MPHRRGTREECVDRLLLLKLLQLLREASWSTGFTKLQKLVFLAEREAIGEKMECFHYTYVKAKHGPYSPSLSRDVNALVLRGYIELPPRITDSGEEVLGSFETFFDRNASQVSILRDVVREFGGKPLEDLLQYVYSLRSRLRGQNVPIAELPLRHPILIPHKFENRITLTGEELVKLRIMMDPETEDFWLREIKGREVVLFRVRGDRWISVAVPSLPGCLTQGLTEEEALRNAEEAIELHLEAEVED